MKELLSEPQVSETHYDDDTVLHSQVDGVRFRLKPNPRHYMLDVDEYISRVFGILCGTLEGDKEKGGDGNTFSFTDMANIVYYLEKETRSHVMIINDEETRIVAGVSYSDFSKAIQIINKLILWNQIEIESLRFSIMPAEIPVPYKLRIRI